MTARHVLPAITVLDSTKGTPEEVTIYQPRGKTHLVALAMNKRESKKSRRGQSLKKPKKNILDPTADQAVVHSRRNSENIEISVTDSDNQQVQGPKSPGTERRSTTNSANASPKRSPTHRPSQVLQDKTNPEVIPIHSPHSDDDLMAHLENVIAMKLKKPKGKKSEKDPNDPSLLCVPGGNGPKQRLEKSQQDFAPGVDDVTKIVIEEIAVPEPVVVIPVKEPEPEEIKVTTNSKPPVFSFLGNNKKWSNRPGNGKYSERQERILRNAISAFIYMSRRNDPIRKRWRRWKTKDAKIEKEAQYEEDYEPEWMKNDSQGYAIGRRIYEKSEIEPEYNPREKSSTMNQSNRKIDLKNAAEIFGLWDNVYGKDAIKALELSQRWDPAKKDREKKAAAIKKTSDAVSIHEDDVSEKDEDIPTVKKLQEEELCVYLTETNFNILAIKNWHKAFFNECPSGQLTKEHMHKLFQNLFPVGDTMPFCEAIFRIFSNRHNADYLEFREFLNAMNVTTLRSEEEKFKWAFKLYDVDNSGSLNFEEMGSIIRMLEDIEGPRDRVNTKGITDMERLDQLFQTLDKDGDGQVTMDEFVSGYIALKAKFEATKGNSSVVVSVSISDNRRRRRIKEKESVNKLTHEKWKEPTT